MAACMAAWGKENASCYSGQITHENVVSAHGHFVEMADHMLLAEAAAPDEASAMALRGLHVFALSHVRS